MIRNVNSTILAASILCTVFGLSVARFDNRRFHWLQRTYCLIITTLVFTIDAIDLFNRLCNFKLGFVSVILLVATTSAAMSRTIYHLKLFLNEDITINIVDNLNYIDGTLDSIGIKFPRIRDFMVLILYVVFSISSATIVTYLFLLNINNSKALNDVISGNVYFTCIRFLTFCSGLALQYYINVIFYIVKTRLTIIRVAISNYDFLKDTAWSASCTEGRKRITVAQKHQLCNTYYSIHKSIVEAYANTKTLYTIHFRLNVLVFILVPSLYLVYTTAQKSQFHLFLFMANMFATQGVPIWLSTCITTEFNRIQISASNTYYENRFSLLKGVLRKWILLYNASETIHDCGYFDVEISLFYFVFDFFILFVFAML